MKKILVLILILFAVVLFLFLFSCSDNLGNESENVNTGPETRTERPTIETDKNYVPVPPSLNVVYKTAPVFDGTAELRMDIYHPTVKKYEKSPLVVCFHGGGWIAGDKSQIMYIFAPVISELRESGYTVATAQYRYANGSIYFPSQIEDGIDAILYLKNNADEYNIDTDSIGVLGYSAGAHLAMLSSYATAEFSAAGETETNDIIDIKYCVSAAGPTKMYGDEPSRYSRSTLYLLENLFQGTYPEKEEIYKKGSPYFYIDNTENTNANKTKKVPLLLIHDENDNVVPYEQSQVMFDKAKETGIPCELLTLRGIWHNIDFSTDYMASPDKDEAVDIILDFICKYSWR